MKGICFIEPLFHKVVKGQKTQTRSMINPEPIIKNDWFIKGIEGWKNSPFGVVFKYPDCEPERFEIMQLLKPKYKVGEIVYLKEPYHKDSNDDVHYKLGYPENQQEMDKHNLKWKNKLFMPESAARYFIKITAIRAERLQDISDEDCLKEGIEWFTKDNRVFKYGLDGWVWSDMPRSPKEAYATLIDKINGKGTWNGNPWVWVYDFELTNN